MEKRKPEHEIRKGQIVATIWKLDSPRGEKFQVAFKRIYKRDGAWKDARNFYAPDLPVVVELAAEGGRWLDERVRVLTGQVDSE